MEAPSDGLTDLERMQVLETFLSLFIIAIIYSNNYVCKRRGRLQKCDKMARGGLHPKNNDNIYALNIYNIITRIIPLIINVTILQAKANAISDASLESSRRMMGMLMEVTRMTMMMTMRVMVVLTRMTGMLMEVTRMTMMMTMNEMKGDGDYANGDDDNDHGGNIN